MAHSNRRQGRRHVGENQESSNELWYFPFSRPLWIVSFTKNYAVPRQIKPGILGLSIRRSLAISVFSYFLLHPSVTDPVESLSSPGFRKKRHWVDQFPTVSAYFRVGFFHKFIQYKNGQLSKMRGFLFFPHYPLPRKWLLYWSAAATLKDGNNFTVIKLVVCQ